MGAARRRKSDDVERGHPKGDGGESEVSASERPAYYLFVLGLALFLAGAIGLLVLLGGWAVRTLNLTDPMTLASTLTSVGFVIIVGAVFWGYVVTKND